MKKCSIDHTQAENIPLFLCAICNPRPKYESPRYVPTWTDPVALRQVELRAQQLKSAQAKRRESLKSHLDKHPFEKWDAKSKSWVRDEAKINAHHAKMEQTDAQSCEK